MLVSILIIDSIGFVNASLIVSEYISVNVIELSYTMILHFEII